MRINYLTAGLFCFLIFLTSCSDYSKKLGEEYVYRDEGGDIKEIFCENPDGGEVPATIVAFDYNKDFIIAKQKPKIPPDPLYDKEYLYDNGPKSVYYWLIVKKKNITYGPLDSLEFIHIRNQYKVPNKLDFR